MTRLLSALVGDPETEAFFSDAAEAEALLRVEVALAEAQAEVGMISAEAAEAIRAACRALDPDMARLSEAFARDGVLIPELVRQLRAGLGDPFAASLHLAATSQDIIDTALMLRLKAMFGAMDVRLERLLDLLDHLVARDGSTRLMAHTRMQSALPFTVADKLATWARPLEAHRALIRQISETRLAVQLGGPIGTLAQFKGKGPEIADGMARRLGLADAPSWHADRSRIAEVGHALTLLSGTLGKIGQDLSLMVQNEVGAARLEGGGGSSAMAHKANPVGAEVLVSLARFAAGMNGTLGQALVHENERSGAAWTLEWMVLPQMAVAAGAGLRTASTLLSGLSFPTDAEPG